MGLFWTYFKDGLRWPLIQRAGALAALVEGAARTLDQAREDILWLRRQCHPATCEEQFLDRLGQARGLVRRPQESTARWRARVVKAYAWQRLGGSQSGMPRILELYDFPGAVFTSLRQEDAARWAEFRVEAPITEEISREGVESLLWVVNDTKPARSKLAEVILYQLATGGDLFTVGAVAEAEAALDHNELFQLTASSPAQFGLGALAEAEAVAVPNPFEFTAWGGHASSLGCIAEAEATA